MTRLFVRMPASVGVLAIYLVARLLTTGMLGLAAVMSGPASRFGAHAGIGDFVLAWDAQWYWYIAVHNYPTQLPVTPEGAVTENSWAFMPLYPKLAQLVGLPFGSWGAGALIVSLVAGYFACLVMYRMMSRRIGRTAAIWSTVFLAAGPLGALFQVGYAEVLCLLFLLLALDGLIRRRYVRLYVLIPLMGFTRPGVLAFALLLGLVLVMRWWRRRTDPLGGREIAHFLALGALGTIVGFSWQIIAGIVTGEHDAYLTTELSWRKNWTKEEAHGFFPFEGWVTAAQMWFRIWGLPGWVGIVVLVLLVAAAAAMLLFGPRVKRLGPEIRLWSASYLLYLLAVFFPQSSTLRLLFPLAPLWGAVAIPRSRLYRWGVLVVCLALQWLWIFNVFAMGNTFWRVP
ncbi:hypothetical protein J2Y69_000125 [Microbacterium resistens]|uniref:Integral membrane protein n=1 Tax=Microbacterium resistens TaxID=156977 RepID=A0ABU1S7F6_9MICO|nr:hypothetical protein [Microbacterium resistens]MDR6865543.1 hypothetical protein [Microbacterium resistens]